MAFDHVKDDLLSLPSAVVRHSNDKSLWTKSEARLWCIVLFIGTTFAYAARVALPICAVAMSKEYGWTKTDTGTVLSCFFWGYVSTQVIAGWLADRIGGDFLLTSAAFVWGLLTFLTPYVFYYSYATTTSPMVILIIFRILFGLSQGFHFPCAASLVSRNLIGTDKGRVFGIILAGSHAGTVLCGSAGSVILEYLGWRMLFYSIGSASIIWSFYARHLMYNSRLNKKSDDEICAPSVALPQVISNEDATHSVCPAKRRLGPVGVVTTCLALLQKPAFWAAFVAHYCGANAYFTLFSWLPSYFTENYPDAEVWTWSAREWEGVERVDMTRAGCITHRQGWVFNFVPNLAVMCTSLLAPWLSVRLINREGLSITLVRKLMEGISQVGLALCLFLVSTVDGYSSALFFLSAAMALRGFHHGGVVVNPQDFAPNHTGTAYGLMNIAGALPGFIGVYVAGYLLETSHGWSQVFNVTGALCLVGVAVYSAIGTGKQII